MGLDMYLERCDRMAYGFKDMDIDDVKENKPKLYDKIKPYIHERGEYFHWESIFEGVGYWRKANQIHRWFVENVQDYQDDCEYYEVEREQLEELLDICVTIKTNCKLINGKVKCGEHLENDVWVADYEDGKVLDHPEIAENYLPTQRGFFFGGTDYDEWYMQDIENTIDILTKVLKETDFDTQMIVYTSSW